MQKFPNDPNDQTKNVCHLINVTLIPNLAYLLFRVFTETIEIIRNGDFLRLICTAMSGDHSKMLPKLIRLDCESTRAEHMKKRLRCTNSRHLDNGQQTHNARQQTT